MTQDEFNEFCASLPHTLYVCQWGGADVWKVGTPEKNKLFVVGGWNKQEAKRERSDRPGKNNDDGSQFCTSFKCGEIAYDFLRDTPGCRPAPYLASRGMKWIQRMTNEGVSDEELKNYLRESYRLASLNLTKKLQKELGLNQGGGDV